MDVDLQRRPRLRQHLVHALQPAHPELHHRRRAGQRLGARRKATRRSIRRWSAGWAGPRTLITAAAAESLFRRAYDYAPDLKNYPDQPPSAGLIGVPIQVWSTKTFSASWHRPVDPKTLIDADLAVGRRDADGDEAQAARSPAICRWSWKMPCCCIAVTFYRLGDLTARQAADRRSMSSRSRSVARPDAARAEWLRPDVARWPGNERTRYKSTASILLITAVRRNPARALRNSGLRYLDQNGALSQGLHATRRSCSAGRPTARWQCRDGVAERPFGEQAVARQAARDRRAQPIDGTLSQETYVRIYIPVK